MKPETEAIPCFILWAEAADKLGKDCVIAVSGDLEGLEEARAKIVDRMRAQGFSPNLWICDSTIGEVVRMGLEFDAVTYTEEGTDICIDVLLEENGF